MLPDLKQAGKKPVPNTGTKFGPGRKRMFRNARDMKFPGYFWEISGSQEMPFHANHEKSGNHILFFLLFN